MAVRLFIGNLPYGATEADLRAHFAAVAEPSHVVMPVDRETGRPRGFAFVEFAERSGCRRGHQANSTPSPSRDATSPSVKRGPAKIGRRARPGRWLRGSAHAPAAAVASAAARGRRLRRSFGPAAAVQPASRPGRPARVPAAAIAARTSARRPRRSACAARRAPSRSIKPRGPIKERSGGRIYAVDDLEDDKVLDIDDVATKPGEEPLELDDSADSPRTMPPSGMKTSESAPQTRIMVRLASHSVSPRSGEPSDRTN